MSRLPVGARRRISNYEDEVAERFDSTIISNTLYDRLGEDEQLIELVRAAAQTETAAEVRHLDHAPEGLLSAVDQIDRVVESRVEEVVDSLLGDLLDDLDEWSDVWSEEEIEDARREAEAYLDSESGSEEDPAR